MELLPQIGAEAGPRGEATLDEVVAALAGARSVLCTMHAWPDGDALGSTLGLAHALNAAGKRAVVYNPSPVPASLDFLPGADRVVAALDGGERFDAVVVCDVGHPSRLGPHLPGPERRGVLVNLDHHLTTPRFGDLNLIDPRAAAVGVIVHRILRRAGLPIPQEAATCLYASLVTDTGSFRYSNTDPEALRVAAELVELGARPGEVSQALNEREPVERLRLLALVLPTLELLEGGRVGLLVVHHAHCLLAGTAEETADGFVTYPRSVAGVEVAVLLREEPGRPWRVSLRSRGRVDVSAVARAFGGGGHHNAAGCSLSGTEAEVRRQVLAAVSAALEAAPARAR